jgi:hypothetical protein
MGEVLIQKAPNQRSLVHVGEIPYVLDPRHGVLGQGACLDLSRVLRKVLMGMRFGDWLESTTCSVDNDRLNVMKAKRNMRSVHCR